MGPHHLRRRSPLSSRGDERCRHRGLHSSVSCTFAGEGKRKTRGKELGPPPHRAPGKLIHLSALASAQAPLPDSGSLGGRVEDATPLLVLRPAVHMGVPASQPRGARKGNTPAPLSLRSPSAAPPARGMPLPVMSCWRDQARICVTLITGKSLPSPTSTGFGGLFKVCAIPCRHRRSGPSAVFIGIGKGKGRKELLELSESGVGEKRAVAKYELACGKAMPPEATLCSIELGEDWARIV